MSGRSVPLWIKVKKIFLTKSIRHRLMAFMLIQAVTITVIIGMLSYRNASQAMQKRAIDFSSELLSTKAHQIDEYLKRMEQYGRDILYDKSIYDLLSLAQEFDHDDLYAESKKRVILRGVGEPVTSLFNKTLISRVEIQSLALLDNKGHIWTRSNDNAMNYDIADIFNPLLFEDLEEIALSAQGKQGIYVYAPEKDAKDILFIRSIYSPDTFQHMGYLIMLADLDYFHGLVASYDQEKGYHTLLLDANKQIIYQANEIQNAKGINQYLDKNILWQVDYDKKLLYTRCAISYVDWDILAIQDLDVLFQDTAALKDILIIITTLIILFFTILSFIMTADIINPIKRLTQSMKRVRSGETDVNVVVDRKDELGYMSETFNDMVRKNEMLVKTIYREQITTKDAHIQALQSQINPHFLFNTLESISWTARLKGVDEISEMVEDLADIIQESIGKDKSLIPLRVEIEYIDKYLRIMKKRFGDRLKIHKHISKDLLEYKIPRLLIQPLIENAIYHGIDKCREGGYISINATKTNQSVQIMVCNSGKGMTEEETEMINDHLSRSSDEYFFNLKDNQRQHVGLENVNRRIKLYYGEICGIRISSRLNCYTKVTATLPLGGIEDV